MVDMRQRPIAMFDIEPRVVIDSSSSATYTYISETYDMDIATNEQGWRVKRITNSTGTTEFAKYGTSPSDTSGTVRSDDFKFIASIASTYTF